MEVLEGGDMLLLLRPSMSHSPNKLVVWLPNLDLEACSCADVVEDFVLPLSFKHRRDGEWDWGSAARYVGRHGRNPRLLQQVKFINNGKDMLKVHGCPMCGFGN